MRFRLVALLGVALVAGNFMVVVVLLLTMPREVRYEVHCEVDGHVTGSRDEDWAEKRAREIEEETGQETEVVKVVDEW